MPKISIITDTDSSLPPKVASQYNIVQVPISVHFGEEIFEDVYDIDVAACFARIDREGKLPTTAAPPPGIFTKAYDKAFEQGADQVICLTVSSEISATFASAKTARELTPERDITVIDSRSVCMGLGYMALAAAEAVQKGASVNEAIAYAEDVRERSHLYAALATLKYLRMSGRIGHLAAGMATLLDVKPIMTITEGKLAMLERVRTRQKSWDRVCNLVEETLSGGKQIERMSIIHTTALKDAAVFEALLRQRVGLPAEVLYAELNPGLSIHTGTGIVGVTFVVGKPEK